MNTKIFRTIIALNAAALILNVAVFVFLSHSIISVIAAAVSATIIVWFWSTQAPSRR